MDPLKRVALTIASFKNDEQVLDVLRRVRKDLPRFASVLVVDSLGTGRFQQALEQEGLADLVKYRCFDHNLGSAGNFAQRLAWAAETSAEFAYAVNHDGDVQSDAIERLVGLSQRAQGPLGALYPMRRMTNRGGAFDITGRYRFPFTAIRTRRVPSSELCPVFWSSSNGALYSLVPVRAGLLPYSDLWMAYEDLGYGWLLHSAGYRQFAARDVHVDDDYEYRATKLGHVTRKPAWYAYYYARNLQLIARRTHQPMAVRSLVFSRVLLELGVTLAFRTEKKTRLTLLAHGIIDGLQGRGGKWRLP
jgi:GT2 family glycosyltransferase